LPWQKAKRAFHLFPLFIAPKYSMAPYYLQIL
jgi:hypothetical protein